MLIALNGGPEVLTCGEVPIVYYDITSKLIFFHADSVQPFGARALQSHRYRSGASTQVSFLHACVRHKFSFPVAILTTIVVV
jgi:hypothetical protein